MNEIYSLKREIYFLTKELEKIENIVRKVKDKLYETHLPNDSWESFFESFSKKYPEFYTTLERDFPELTSMEIKVCILIRGGLQSTDISQVLAISVRTIENHRFNLRKKLKIKERANLVKFLEKL